MYPLSLGNTGLGKDTVGAWREVGPHDDWAGCLESGNSFLFLDAAFPCPFFTATLPAAAAAAGT